MEEEQEMAAPRRGARRATTWDGATLPFSATRDEWATSWPGCATTFWYTAYVDMFSSVVVNKGRALFQDIIDNQLLPAADVTDTEQRVSLLKTKADYLRYAAEALDARDESRKGWCIRDILGAGG